MHPQHKPAATVESGLYAPHRASGKMNASSATTNMPYAKLSKCHIGDDDENDDDDDHQLSLLMMMMMMMMISCC